jgi:hypothetical protein
VAEQEIQTKVHLPQLLPAATQHLAQLPVMAVVAQATGIKLIQVVMAVRVAEQDVLVQTAVVSVFRAD